MRRARDGGTRGAREGRGEGEGAAARSRGRISQFVPTPFVRQMSKKEDDFPTYAGIGVSVLGVTILILGLVMALASTRITLEADENYVNEVFPGWDCVVYNGTSARCTVCEAIVVDEEPMTNCTTCDATFAYPHYYDNCTEVVEEVPVPASPSPSAIISSPVAAPSPLALSPTPVAPLSLTSAPLVE